MVMDTLQIRIPKGLVETIDSFVKKGVYSSRSDAVRDALRNKFIWDLEVGSVPNKSGKSGVEQVREIRKKMSKQIKSYEDLEKINGEFKDHIQ